MIRHIAKILGLGTLAGAFVFAACDGSGTAPPSAGSIIGDVNMEGRGLDGVTVSLSNGTTATTAADGSFRFHGIAPGTYEVSISGYPAHAAFGATSKTVALGTRGGPATVAFGATNSDRDALLALYDSTGGKGWTRSDNWDTSAPLGDWHGVTTDATGRVTELWLQGNNLRGTIPAAVGGLTQLDVLALFREPGLTGPIPPELGNLAELRLLALGGNAMTGAIPPELGNLTELIGLYLWGNSLTGAIPPELGNLSRLQGLQLDGPVASAAANADGIPVDARADAEQPRPEFAVPYRAQAREFRDRDPESADIAASRNNVGLTGPIPPGIWNLRDLTLLTLARNRLTGGIPPEVGNLTNLEELSVQDNQLTGAIPAALWTLTDLTLLSIAGNRLTGSIPPEIGDFGNLKIFWAANNDLSGSIPPEIGGLDSLTHLGLHDNSLTGTVPASLGNLTSLVQLALSRNDLRGAIPPELGNLGNLEALYLNQNRLDGGIPPELGALDSLTSLSLRGNELTGAIPPEIGELSRLVQLWVHTNPLSGPLPLTMTNLANLSVFNFSATRLCVPDDQGFVSWLQSVGNVTGSGLDCGSIAGDRGVLEALYYATDGPNWTNSTNWTTDRPLEQWHGVSVDSEGRVTGLHLQENNLSGQLRPEIGALGSLEWLHLGGNNLTGPIPPEIGDLASLTQLYLWGNGFSGPVPNSFVQLQRLVVFSVDPINCVPATAAFTAWLQRFTVLVSGTIRCHPDAGALVALYEATDGPNWTNDEKWLTVAPLGEWYGVTVDDEGRVNALNLPKNNLSGPISAEVGRLDRLGTLALHENNLTGPIPPELGSLASMRDLNLWGNGLSGSIPPELGNLANMWQLVLSANNLTDSIPPELGNLGDSLVVLELHRNNLAGPIPDSFLQLQRLVHFYADVQNCVPATAAFTAWLQQIPNREATVCAAVDRAALQALYNATDGPNWTNSENWTTDAPLGDWHGVTTDASGRVVGIGLFSNNLTGSIPPDLGRLASLGRLHLARNSLTGPIPPEFGSLANLSQLTLDDNDLRGSIPPELGNLGDTLRVLRLNGNNLTGPIPDSFLQLRRLVRFGADIHNCVPATAAFTAWFEAISDRRAWLCTAADRAVLERLYQATDGRRWTNRRNWLTDASLEDWHGVTTDDAGRVVGLDLRENNLTGPIPSQLGDLARLVTLDLGSNRLTDSIPSRLGDLTALTTLSLWGNDLSGPIPPELGSLPNLGDLNLWGNRLSGSIPAELGNLANLWQLALSFNNLSGPIPPELGNLGDALVVLHLHNNNLSGRIPESFLQLQRLQSFHGDLHNCTPPWLAFKEWLERIPDRGATTSCTLTDRAALERLYEATDGRNWTNSTNWLTDAPIGDWHGVTTNAPGRVTALRLDTNKLTGAIPRELAALASLRDLQLAHNRLSGAIPRELGNLNHLWRLRLTDNRLTGSIPPELSNLDSLSFLQLTANQLTGPIPHELGNLSRLRVLHLFNNHDGLSGPIPDSFLGLTGLWSFYVDSVNCVPATTAFTAWLQAIDDRRATLCSADKTALVALYRATDGPNWTNSTNWLTNAPVGEWEGVYPDGSGRVALLVLDGNNLTGPIPPALGNLANLVSLQLPANRLTGPIPSQFGNLVRLERLSLSENQLSGPIPSQFGNLVRLEQLSLSGNQLSGPIPPQLGNLASLEGLSLSGNQLSGPIPPQLGNLASLEGLSLSGNQLSGPIPPQLGNLARLDRLFLNGNQLSGPVPPDFGRMASLRRAFFMNNQLLSGALPTALTALTNLEEFLAGSTDLCAPQDPVFQAWLLGISKRRVASCAAGESMAYLTQAVQSREFPVPLVAGEKAMLRVFPTAVRENGAHIPAIRVGFFHFSLGPAPRAIDIPGKPVYIPTEIDEGDLMKSANVEIPGRLVQPGLEMVILIDPDDTLDPALGVPKRIPETGRLAVDVRPMRLFDLTLIPFIWSENPDSSIIGEIDGMAADPGNHRKLRDTRTLLPIGGLKVTAHEPVLSSSNNTHRLLDETKAIRAMEGGRDHYMGMMSGETVGPAGKAAVGGRSSFSRPIPSTMAHELGHNLNLRHAPCLVTNADPDFPYRRGNIGAWGYDFLSGGRLVHPSKPDLMSYCDDIDEPTTWVSDYHFTNALSYRLNDPANVGSAAPSLLLWGGVGPDGAPFLEPAFVVDAPAALPDSTGAYRITGRDHGGDELFTLSFTMPEVADGDGRSSFGYVLPARPGWEGNLASITLSGPGGSASLDGESDLPMVILRNPRNGQVRGILRGPAATTQVAADGGTARATGLQVLFSRGVPGTDAWRR